MLNASCTLRGNSESMSVSGLLALHAANDAFLHGDVSWYAFLCASDVTTSVDVPLAY